VLKSHVYVVAPNIIAVTDSQVLFEYLGRYNLDRSAIVLCSKFGDILIILRSILAESSCGDYSL
jgi:hypothetical protein